MELSPAQRRIAFALVVLALAALGVYLFTSGRAVAHPAAAPPRHNATQAAQQRSQPSQAPSQPQAYGPATPPVPTPLAPDIYQWLPFTQAGLSRAASVAVRFGQAYGTFSYTESAAAYVATMHNLVMPQLGEQIAAAYSTPGVVGLRTSRKQVSTGTAAITSLRAFGPSSLTFRLAVTERLSATRGASQTTTSYAVTLTGGDTSWQVSDIELASAGNS